MSGLGVLLAIIGFIGLVVGLLQMRKHKKLNSVPFRAPSQIAQLGPGAADAKGMVSTEGIVNPQGLLYGPMSGRPCLAFEITVSRRYEKTERTENGNQTTKSSENVFSDYRGAIFALQDPQGTVLVDATVRPDADFEKAHTSDVAIGFLGIIPGTLQFGNLQMNTPSTLLREGRTLGFEGTEKILPPSGSLYALGGISVGEQGPFLHTPRGIGTGKLILSSKGRASLVASTKRKMTLGYAIGGALFVGGTLMGIFGPSAPRSASTSMSCPSTFVADAVACDGRIYDKDGSDYKWTVTTAGEYTIVLKQPSVKYPIDGTLTIKDASGAQVGYNDGGSPGADAKIVKRFEPGTYTVNVRDYARSKVKGGYSFHLDVTRTEPVTPVSSASITSADVTPSASASAKPAPKKPGAPAASAKPAATAKTAAKK